VQVLEYSPSLADWIDQGKELGLYNHTSISGGGTITNTTSGRMQELYIRAATVVVAQRLVEECRQKMMESMDRATTNASFARIATNEDTKTIGEDGQSSPLVSYHLNDVLVDWYLWQLGEGMLSTMKPHHRVRTIYY
jgi:hypothetical protein